AASPARGARLSDAHSGRKGIRLPRRGALAQLCGTLGSPVDRPLLGRIGRAVPRRNGGRERADCSADPEARHQDQGSKVTRYSMLDLVFEVSLRSVGAAAAVGLVLIGFRVRSGAGRHAAWSAVLVTMLTMPVLIAVVPRVDVPVPSTV